MEFIDAIPLEIVRLISNLFVLIAVLILGYSLLRANQEQSRLTKELNGESKKSNRIEAARAAISLYAQIKAAEQHEDYEDAGRLRRMMSQLEQEFDIEIREIKRNS